MQPGQTRSTTSFNNMGSLALVLPHRRQDAGGGGHARLTLASSASTSLPTRWASTLRNSRRRRR